MTFKGKRFNIKNVTGYIFEIYRKVVCIVTIKKVAELAGVSTATVSRVLNNKGNVSARTKMIVEDIIHEMEYEPNDLARMLYRGRSNMIALLVPDIMNPFFPELARAVEDTAKSEGYTCILCNTDGDYYKEISYIKAITQKKIDGVIIVSNTITEDEVDDINLPVVMLDRKTKANVNSITIDNQAGVQDAINFLKSLGCKKIAHLAGPENDINAQVRKDYYLKEVGQEKWFDSDMIAFGDYDFDKSVIATKKILSNNSDIDGLFAGNDLMGFGALKAAYDLRIDVPKSLSVIGFDGISLGETVTPSLTTMEQPIYDMGMYAVKILLDQIEGEKVYRHKKFFAQLKKRESTKQGD